MNKTTIRIILGIIILFLAYICVDSVVTPIRFESQRAERTPAVTKNLIALRTAEQEWKAQKGYYTQDLDSLLTFVKTATKKEVLKEGALTDTQLEAGLTEKKAVKIINTALAKAYKKATFNSRDDAYQYIWKNDKDVTSNQLVGFRRDTIETNLLSSLYKGEYTEESINKIIYIPYTDNVRFTVLVNNNYENNQGVRIPLLEINAPYDTYLGDLDDQERVNLIDKETKLEHFAGLRIGDSTTPNNNAGNWE